ncbi:MAG: Coenzyme F420 hydrogenase/dehydrogenase, beta subunit C-terminal domain, partial [Albidovulum sp.]|nr:Coenzyme F420 hydrogenase/dehydrogenase, beta subunit C-terminal domain [Albidovulum sp.]
AKSAVGKDVTLFRYRGFGNPGRTRIEFHDGHAEERTYSEMWADESKWCIQARCKICPDAIGESADIAAADFWLGGTPSGEDAGFNSIIIRSRRGGQLLSEAIAAGAIKLTRDVTVEEMSDTQPHQVRKKANLWARLVGMRAAGHPVPKIEGLRLSDLARGQSLSELLGNARGARSRCRDGRLSEPPALAEGNLATNPGSPAKPE